MVARETYQIVYNPQVVSLGHMVWTLRFLGYPEQALTRSQEALQLAQDLAHPLSLVIALSIAARLHLERGDERVAQECADATIVLSSEHGFPLHLAWGTVHRGEALIVQDQWEEGVAQVRQGLEANGGGLSRTNYLAWLAEGYKGTGQGEGGLAAVAEALRLVDKNDGRVYEAELYRVKGTLTLQQENQKAKIKN